MKGDTLELRWRMLSRGRCPGNGSEHRNLVPDPWPRTRDFVDSLEGNMVDSATAARGPETQT